MIIHDKWMLDSARHKDANGYMHVDTSNLTKEQVVPYLGSSIPEWKSMGLEADKVYMIYRPAKEIEKAVDTFNGLPLLLDHWDIDAENIPKDKVVGSLGTDARWEAPYLKNSLIITDAQAIKAIEDGSYAELSASYACDIDMTGGIFDGVAYDGSMHNILGNHVALVAEGRAGHDVKVADSAMEGGEKMDWKEKFKNMLLEIMTDKEAVTEIMANEETKVIPDEDVEMNEAPVVEQATDEEPVDELADDIRQWMTEAGLDPEDKNAQKAFLAGMAVSEKADDACKDADEATDACGKDEAEVADEDAKASDEPDKASDSKMVADKAFYAELWKASNVVAPIIGRIDNPFMYDSASSIYAKALKKLGIATDGIDPSAYGSLVAYAMKQRSNTMPSVDTEEDPLTKKLKSIKSV